MNYNVIYDKSINVDALIENLKLSGAEIIEHFSSLNVLKIAAEGEDFKTVANVLHWEEDIQLMATPSAWHQNRVYSISLPIMQQYYPDNLGAGVTVYLVDSGLEISHPEFENQNVVQLYSYNSTFDDELGHGTKVGSLIVGKTLGVSPEVTLKVVKIPMLAQIPVSTLLAAFDAILFDHSTSTQPKVVNCSWTIIKSQILDMKIAELQAAGLVVVAAAGNTGEAADNFSPVGLNTVIGVAASDAYDRVISWATGASSNWGPEVDITAPGVHVDIATTNGEYAEGSGTSLAAGIVSGIVAQYIVEFPEKNATEIQEKIIERGRPDLLFRNETIYGTTPNLFIAGAGIGSVFDPSQSSRIEVKRGEVVEQELLYRTDVVTDINVEGVIVTGMPRINAAWMEYDKDTHMIKVSPPADVEPAIYRMYVEAFMGEGQRIAVGTFSISVYAETPEENQVAETPEVYFRPEGENVMVVPAVCSNNFCFSAGSCSGTPQKGNQCGCIDAGCGSQAT